MSNGGGPIDEVVAVVVVHGFIVDDVGEVQDGLLVLH
jgi:hypothetical protein